MVHFDSAPTVRETLMYQVRYQAVILDVQTLFVSLFRAPGGDCMPEFTRGLLCLCPLNFEGSARDTNPYQYYEVKLTCYLFPRDTFKSTRLGKTFRLHTRWFTIANAIRRLGENAT